MANAGGSPHLFEEDESELRLRDNPLLVGQMQSVMRAMQRTRHGDPVMVYDGSAKDKVSRESRVGALEAAWAELRIGHKIECFANAAGSVTAELPSIFDVVVFPENPLLAADTPQDPRGRVLIVKRGDQIV